MSVSISRTDVSRRAELMAELFLQDLKPEFVARSTADFGYDFFVGFQNPRNGVNNVIVEVKATEKLKDKLYSVSKQQYDRWANSNIPVLLLVIDVKENRFYYARPSLEISNGSRTDNNIMVPLTEIDEISKQDLHDELAN